MTLLLRAIAELSCASPPLDSPDATNATTHKRSGGAEEGILDVRMCGERRLFAQVTLFASGFVIGRPRLDSTCARCHDERDAVCLSRTEGQVHSQNRDSFSLQNKFFGY